MKKIIFIVVILIIASLIGYVYYKYELPKKNQIEGSFINVSISAEFEGKKVPTILIIKNGESKEIETSEIYELINLRKGIYQINNKNLEGQNFYRELKEFNLTEDTRIDYILSKPKEVKAKWSENNSIIKVNIKSENFQNVKYCLKSSINYIFVKSNQTEIKKLDGYKKWDKCYSLDASLINSNETIYISYDFFKQPSQNDYINLSIIDTEYLGNYQNIENNLDIGGEDLIINIR